MDHLALFRPPDLLVLCEITPSNHNTVDEQQLDNCRLHQYIFPDALAVQQGILLR